MSAADRLAGLLLLLAACTPTVHRKLEVRRISSCGEVCRVYFTNGGTANVPLGVQPGDSVWADIPAEDVP